MAGQSRELSASLASLTCAVSLTAGPVPARTSREGNQAALTTMAE